jgi:predicted Zn finger-like uncharacterized protein
VIITCPNCAKKYDIDPARLAGRTSATARCRHCSATIPLTIDGSDPVETTVAAAAPSAAGASPSVEAGPKIEATPRVEAAPVAEPPAGDATMRLPADASQLPAPQHVDLGAPSLPPGMRVSLAILEGKEAGRVIRIEVASVIIGRHGADVLVDDPEVSRHHARLDIHAARGVVRDLGSTNGVFVNDRKVSEAEIENRGEFRVGGTKLMLILTEEESGA